MVKYSYKTNEFKAIRVRVLDSLLLYMTLGAVPLLATSLLNFYTSGWKVSMIVDVVGLFSIPLIYFLRRRISYNFKSTYLISMGYLAGIIILHDYSFLGTGMIILCSISLVSTLFFGKVIGWVIVGINILSFAFIGILFQYDILTYKFSFDSYIHSPLTWLDQAISFLFFIGTAIIASGQIHEALLDRIRQTTLEKDKFQNLFNIIQDAILIYSPDGKILEMNDSLLNMYGIARNSALVTRAGDFAIDKAISINSGGNVKWQCEAKAKRFDNQQEFYVEMMLSLIDYNGEKAVLANIRNITSRKVAEEALKESEEKYRSLTESSPAGIFIIRSERFIYVNPAGVKVLGYKSMDEIAGRNVYSFVAQEFKKIAEKRLESASQEDVNESLELKLFRADGSELWADLISLPFKYYGSRAVLVMGFDITKRKRAEELLLQKNKEIATSNLEYEQLNKRLKFAKEKAEESDRLKSAFLSNMSHEIRTPMNAILGFSDLLIKAQLTEGKKREYTEIIHSSGKQLLSLINDIIDISKIESNQIVIDNTSKVNLYEVFKHLSLVFSNKAASRNIGLDYNISLPQWQSLVFADEVRLMQILVNLIGNAIKFTHRGHVRFEVSQVDSELLFTVEDTGIGIEPQVQTIIFDRFRQADGSTTRDYGGTGLGLAISKALVELMGGKIWLNSMPGRGTTFYFTIPYKPDINIEALPPGSLYIATEMPNWSEKTLLLVEDEEINIVFLEELLAPTGVNLLVARNASQAYEKVKATRGINLVLLDIRIPEVNGYQIVKVLKKKHPNMPVIAQTAYALAEERKTIMESGFDDYIAKPISKQSLFGIISKYLT